MSFKTAVHKKAIEIGKLSVEMTTAAGSGHPSTALSLTHLITVLMYHQMRWDPKDPWNLAADRLVLSEGHAVPIVYAAYADLGGVIGRSREEARPMTKQDALSLRAIDSPIDGTPTRRSASPSLTPPPARSARASASPPAWPPPPGWTASTATSTASSATGNPARGRSGRRSTSSSSTA